MHDPELCYGGELGSQWEEWAACSPRIWLGFEHQHAVESSSVLLVQYFSFLSEFVISLSKNFIFIF